MTDNRPIITAYCLDWHISTSGSMHDLLIHPLAPYAEIRQVAWTGLEELPAPQDGETIIFYMLPPTEAWLNLYHTPVIWVPMADAIYYPPNIKNHPSVRVVAFSNVVVHVAQTLGLPAIPLRYFCNPETFLPANFDGERVLLYWNRTGFFNKRFLLTLCRELKVDRLIFRSAIDPKIDTRHYYDLPDKIGDMVIETYPTLTSYADYLALLRRANIFIAPRWVEGVGIALLEAMASGCCVFGYHNVAMNEYIQHNHNGYLFSAYRVNRVTIQIYKAYTWFFKRVYQKWVQWRTGRIIEMPKLTLFQDWGDIRQLDIATLGKNARQTHQAGYTQWIASIPRYADFILKGKL